MELTLIRIKCAKEYTIGKLYVDGVFFCHTIEDTWRDILHGDQKVSGKTCIPDGAYNIDMDTVSPRFGRSSQYTFCGGKLPRLMGVPKFSGILIHVGNTPADTDGCILVGKSGDTNKGFITDSYKTFRALYTRLECAHKRGESIVIKIRHE